MDQAKNRSGTYFLLLAGLTLLVVAVHLPYLTLPFFWDELGYYVPAALDLFRQGLWIPQSTAPVAHPPLLRLWLAAAWTLAGYSIPVTRVAMLILAAAGVLFTFLLAIRLCRGTPGAPAFPAVLYLLVSPLFYTQAMMAQVDMPAMVLTVLSLLLFLDSRYFACVAVCTLLALVKETGAIVPVFFGAWLVLRERRWKEAAWFVVPVAGLLIWLGVQARFTGHLLGDTEYTRYNIWYALHPVRAAAALLRRVYFLFVADFHWIGTIAVAAAWFRSRIYRTREWAITGSLAALHVVAVSVTGGAELERYALPVLPIVYIAMAAASALFRPWWRLLLQGGMAAGMLASFFWNPPYPVPYEDNLAMVDFVELQQTAAGFIDDHLDLKTVATAWPLTDELRNPDFGYVRRLHPVVETTDFSLSNVAAIDPSKVDVLVTYSRIWDPKWSVLRIGFVQRFLSRYYQYEPQITSAQIRARLGFIPVVRWTRRGQWIEIYLNPRTNPVATP